VIAVDSSTHLGRQFAQIAVGIEKEENLRRIISGVVLIAGSIIRLKWARVRDVDLKEGD